MRLVGIDPATRTGFVALDYEGNVLQELELKGAGKAEKGGISVEQLVDLENQLYRLLQPNDLICIEDTPFKTNDAITTGMIHGGLRSMIHRKKLDFDVVNPMWTKKYVDVKVERGQTDKEKKDAVKAAVLEQFRYTHKSHNIVDAYIIARIALNLHRMRQHEPMLDNHRRQIEVVEGIMQKAF